MFAWVVSALIFVPATVLLGNVFGRLFSLGRPWAWAVTAAGMLSSVTFVLRWNDDRFSFVSFRVVGGILLVSALLVVVRRSQWNELRGMSDSWWLYVAAGIPLALAVHSGLVGMVRGNSLGLLAGDTLRLGLTSVAVIVGAGVTRRRAWTFAIIFSLIALAADVLAVGHAAIRFAGIGGSTLARLGAGFGAVLAFGFAIMLSDRRDGEDDPWRGLPRPAKPLVVGALIVVFDFAAGLLSITRTTAAALAAGGLAALLTAWFGWRRADVVRPLLLTGAAMAVLLAGLVFVSPTGDSVLNLVNSKLTDSPGSTDGSISLRTAELEHTAAELDALEAGWLLGAGAGATYAFPPKDDDARHTVHITFASFAYRTGLFGMAAFIVWWLAVLALGLRALIKSKGDHLALWTGIVIVVAAVHSIASFRFIGEAVPSFAVGVAVALHLAHRTRQPATAGAR